MKNLKSPLSLILLVSVILFTACGEQSSKSEAAEERTTIKAPEQIISLSEAKMMYDNYSDRRASMIQKFEDSINISKKDTTKFDVARYTYYDYKTIKDYLAYIEQEAEKAGVEISTLRFYYSNYPDQEKFSDGTKVLHPRQNSFFIMPTLNQEGQEFGFYTEDSGDNGAKRAILINGQLEVFQAAANGEDQSNRSLAGFAAGKAPAPTAYGNGSLVLNHGGAAPPPYQ